MEITLKRDGLTLRGDMEKPDGEKCPAVIIFHGFMGRRNDELFTSIAESCVKAGMAAVRFDFDGHGDSDGDFSDMNIMSEILDASKIIDYVRKLDFVTDIYIVGHSQGGVVGGMMAGYYRERVKKLALLAPAATLKDDALRGSLFGIPYDIENVPDTIPVKNLRGEQFQTGGLYFRIARTLPIYETTAMFNGETLIIHGTNDDAVGVIGSRRYKEWLPCAKLELIEGESHGLCDFSLDYVTKRVTEFLSNENRRL